ncbi:MAG TPA: L-2-amino-thiazoline-4-carboxylic acid hydrolase [Terracidiphilus sp.]|jgi:hypothetical protein|nr:L-2-amino-thiazoline-4-carboxylic acid hydrolase [Terracidiphilus sp.]
MADILDKISNTMRWEIATHGLTAAYIAIAKELDLTAGQDGFDLFNGSLWYEAGKGAKEFANALGEPTDTAEQIEKVTHVLAQASMGPEFKFEVIESTGDRCVGRTTECPWHKRWKEQGIDFDTCSSGHQGWGDGAVESMNPDFRFKLLKNMVRGDSHCEWVVERKK